MGGRCSHCGAGHRPAARYCPNCGRLLTPPPNVAAAAHPAQLPPPPPPPPAALPRGVAGAAPPPSPRTFSRPAAQTPVHLPSAPPPLALEQQLGGLRQSALAQTGGLSGDGGRVAQRVIRAWLLDPTVYREVAADPDAMGEALGVAAVALLAEAFGGTLLTLLSGRIDFQWLLIQWLIQAAVLAAFTGTVMLLGPPLTGTKLPYPAILRATGYASVPSVAGVLPVIGSLLGLWRLATLTAAVRQLFAGDLWRTLGLTVAGLIGGAIGGSVAFAVMPLLRNLL